MIIPIAANKESFTIGLRFLAKRKLSIGIWVYDPYRPYTHYFRRKVQLSKGQNRKIEICLPVSAEYLELKIYDKQGGIGGFKLTDFKITKMPPPVIWASPQQQRFMDFAIDFAQKAGYLPTGFYDSPTQEFLFQYLPAITDTSGKELITPARIHRKMPRVQISKQIFRTLSIPVRVFILSHEGCHWFLNVRSEKKADLCGIRHYLDYGFPKIEAVYAATKIFGRYPDLVGAKQIQRTKDIIAFIDQYTTER
ncbi:hypothetical protein HN014_10720 [Aquimarina sp. TRL1]|uniref:hypothetical protein n=1 Tax=Aquimarina sp. (strain TRL1) TaxID=2736252 RepID=UPI0015897321|nr:hypothetical protein [Aquimarina sp. TRL1]QKX05367.1 hypothetical protein HN014_10720 [Aquimarina sp. TRL1]